MSIKVFRILTKAIIRLPVQKADYTIASLGRLVRQIRIGGPPGVRMHTGLVGLDAGLDQSNSKLLLSPKDISDVRMDCWRKGKRKYAST